MTDTPTGSAPDDQGQGSFRKSEIPTEQTVKPAAPCRNCGGAEWVCESHEDRPWGGMLSDPEACDCGAGAPCPVCNRRMACAPYSYSLPDWRPIGNYRPERDGREVLICGGFYMDESTTFRNWMEAGDEVWLAELVPNPGFGDALALWRGGNVGSHDEYYWHLPTHFMARPRAFSPATGEPR